MTTPEKRYDHHKRVPGEPAKMLKSTQDKLDVFVAAYIAGGGSGAGKRTGGATAAAIAAGYSAKTAAQKAHQLLQLPYVQEKIKEHQAQLLAQHNMTADSVLKQLSAIVHFDVRKLYDANGNLKPITELDDDTAAALASVDVDVTKVSNNIRSETQKVKVFDKNRGIENAMKFFGMLKGDGTQINAGTVIISSEDAKLL